MKREGWREREEGDGVTHGGAERCEKENAMQTSGGQSFCS